VLHNEEVYLVHFEVSKKLRVSSHLSHDEFETLFISGYEKKKWATIFYSCWNKNALLKVKFEPNPSSLNLIDSFKRETIKYFSKMIHCIC